MAILATCSCGAAFNLKDEFAGRLLKCPTCNQTFTAQAPVAVATTPQADPAFDRDKFLLRQKVLTISAKYEVGDENNRPILFVVRPAHPFQNALALLAAIVAAIVVIGGCFVLAVELFGDNETVAGILIFTGFVLGVITAVCVGVPLSAKRHVSFYRNETQSEKLLEVLQDAKFQPINATYTVRDKDGTILATFRKNILYNFFRKRWHVYAPGGTVMCMAMEDSIVLSLLRRLLGPMFGLLRTNFIIVVPDNSTLQRRNPPPLPGGAPTLEYSSPSGEANLIGEFNRKFTLFDRYVLDLTRDPQRTLDRRIALALGVMLDTGEKR